MNEDSKLNDEGRNLDTQGIPHPLPYVEELFNVVCSENNLM